MMPCPFLPPRLRGPDWLATRHSPAQDTRWAAVGKRVMSRPVSAMIAAAICSLTPGISASRRAAGSTAASGVRAGGPVSVHALGGGDLGEGLADAGLELADPLVQEGDLVEFHLGELAVGGAEHSGHSLPPCSVLP